MSPANPKADDPPSGDYTGASSSGKAGVPLWNLVVLSRVLLFLVAVASFIYLRK